MKIKSLSLAIVMSLLLGASAFAETPKECFGSKADGSADLSFVFYANLEAMTKAELVELIDVVNSTRGLHVQSMSVVAAMPNSPQNLWITLSSYPLKVNQKVEKRSVYVNRTNKLIADLMESLSLQFNRCAPLPKPPGVTGSN